MVPKVGNTTSRLISSASIGTIETLRAKMALAAPVGTASVP